VTETSFNRQTSASDFIAQVIAGKKGNARGFSGLVHVNGELKFLFVSTQIIVVHGYLELFLGVCIVCHQKDGACVSKASRCLPDARNGLDMWENSPRGNVVPAFRMTAMAVVGQCFSKAAGVLARISSKAWRAVCGGVTDAG